MGGRLRDDAELSADDSEEMASKYTSVSWGMCIEETGFWNRDELIGPDRRPVSVIFNPEGEIPTREMARKLFGDAIEDFNQPFKKQLFKVLEGCVCPFLENPKKVPIEI